MRKIIASFCIAILFFLSFSCKKKLEDIADFNASVTNTTVHVGDIVQFNLSGVNNPNNIVFYSGEPGMNYDYANRTTSTGKSKLVFRCLYQNGAKNPINNKDTLLLWAISNLNGKIDTSALNNATLTNITNRNTQWPTKNNTSGLFNDTTYTRSDTIDVSDFQNVDSVYFAFQYKSFFVKLPDSLRKWSIDTLKLLNITPEGTIYQQFAPAQTSSSTIPVSNFASTGWIHVSYLPPFSPPPNKKPVLNSWNVGEYGISNQNAVVNSYTVRVVSNYPLVFDAGLNRTNWQAFNDWAITTAVNLKTIRNDVGIGVKTITGNDLNTYQYVYKTPGTYKVQFVGVTGNQDGTNKQVTKPIYITVLP